MTRTPDETARGPAVDATLALGVEVTGTPKPGNVDRHRDFSDLRFEQFVAGAAGAHVGLARAARLDPLGDGRDEGRTAADGDGTTRTDASEGLGAAFEASVAGMARQSGGNTQFGCLLVLVPLVAATVGPSDEVLVDRRVAAVRRDAADRSADRATDDHDGSRDGETGADPPPGGVSRDRVRRVCEATTVADAAAFYRSFEHVDVAVADPPAGMEPLDVRRGADAVETVRERGLTLWELLERSAPHDANAREWTNGFPRTFRAARAIRRDDGPVPDRIARAFLDLLAEEPDTLIRTEHGDRVAARVQRRAAEIDSLAAAESWAEELVTSGINPGTTADLAAAATYVALRRGVMP